MNKKISIIIPVYNGASFLEETLVSASSQTGVQTEVIVVDDGSTDGSATLVTSFPYPLMYIHQEHQGVDRARNCGIAAATGEYILFLDQDDILVPDALEKQCAALEQHPEAGMVMCDGFEIDVEHNADAGSSLLPKDIRTSIQKSGGIISSTTLFQRALYGIVAAPAQVLFKRQVFETIGLFTEEADSLNDYEFYLRVALHYSVIMHAEKLVHKRYHATSASGPHHLRALVYGLTNVRTLSLIETDPVYVAKGVAGDIRKSKYYFIHSVVQEAYYRVIRCPDFVFSIVRSLHCAVKGSLRVLVCFFVVTMYCFLCECVKRLCCTIHKVVSCDNVRNARCSQ